jgi:hypothetical protein
MAYDMSRLACSTVLLRMAEQILLAVLGGGHVASPELFIAPVQLANL